MGAERRRPAKDLRAWARGSRGHAPASTLLEAPQKGSGPAGAGPERNGRLKVALGSPLTGFRPPQQRPEFPYEDATSTEA